MPEGRRSGLRQYFGERMFGWWYLCIGLGFVLLGVRSALRGDQVVPVVLRFLIALGFLALGAGTLRSRAAGE